jgi:hypothetical protein
VRLGDTPVTCRGRCRHGAEDYLREFEKELEKEMKEFLEACSENPTRTETLSAVFAEIRSGECSFRSDRWRSG